MSTYLYLECLDHDPPLKSEGEVGQHLYDLPRIQREVACRSAGDEHHFERNAAAFMTLHPHCTIGIRDEYGHQHPAMEADQ